jgi:hypothetical protein
MKITMSKIKEIQEQWENFNIDPANNPPVTTEDLEFWVKHLNDTADLIVEYPSCGCAYHYINQIIYTLTIILRARKS